LTSLISEAKKNIKIKNYFQAALIYEKIGKLLFKINLKKSIEFFKTAVKYYLKSASKHMEKSQFAKTAKCYEQLAKLYEKWMNNSTTALDYFMTATKYRMLSVKNKLSYNED
ncbi:MAG: hypothetical protein ACTSYR_01600, partial [Candidatus Odinarchaeia archaeon]